MVKRRSPTGNRSLRRILDSVHTESPPLGVQYEQVLTGLLVRLLRHKLLIMIMVATALALGIMATLAMPKRYTAEAYVRGSFAASDSVVPRGTSGDHVAFDASQIVETRSRLFQSHQLARRVLQDLNVEGLHVAGKGTFSWLGAKLNGDVAESPGYQEDLTAMRLLRGLSIATEPRVYQIVLRYTDEDPRRAALITNAFVVEFLRMTTLQSLSGERTSAQAELSESLATLGDKHPKVRGMKMRLAAIDGLIKEELSKPAKDIQKRTGENVTFAEANLVPSSPKPVVVIGIALLIGLFVSCGLAIWLESSPRDGGSKDNDSEATTRFWDFLAPFREWVRN